MVNLVRKRDEYLHRVRLRNNTLKTKSVQKVVLSEDRSEVDDNII